MLKKIVMIHHSGISNGGGSRAFLDLNSILSEDYEISNYVPSSPINLYESMVNQGLRVTKFDFKMGKNTYYSGGNSLFNPKFYYHLLNSITQVQYWEKVFIDEMPDLIILNSVVVSNVAKIALKMGIPCVCFVRETMKKSRYQLPNISHRNNLNKCVDVFFLSEYDKHEFSLKNCKGTVINESIDLTTYESKIPLVTETYDNDKTVILYAGGFGKIKGLDILIKSLGYIDKDKFELLIAGNLPKQGGNFLSNIIHFNSQRYMKNIYRLIRKHSLSNNITYLGSISDMSDFYSRGDFLVIPIREPHQCRPIYEIGSQAKPAITPDFECLSEFIRHNQNGLTFRVNSPKSLSVQINHYLDNKDSIGIHGLNNQKNTINFHDQNKIRKNVLDNIDRIVYSNEHSDHIKL